MAAQLITGADMQRFAVSFGRLGAKARERWRDRAVSATVRGGTSSAQAEYMADRVRKHLRDVERELVRLRAVEQAASAYVLADECAPEYASGGYDALRAALKGGA